MKVMTIVGTRPELIRLSNIIPLLDKYTRHFLIHTGQNYDPNLKDIFFTELGIRPPNSWVDPLQMEKGCTELIEYYQPDKVLILGDTYSGLAAAKAAYHHAPVYHMEAGNRCFLDEVPEEKNRVLIDTMSTVLMPYTENSRQNLLREGYPTNRIFVIGNPIYEVLKQVEFGSPMNGPRLKRDPYFLVTLHRSETIDNKSRLTRTLTALQLMSQEFNTKIIISVHPHLRKCMELFKLEFPKCFRPHKPFGFREFVELEKHALCVLSDSGTVQEECAIMNTPFVALRDVTERPETIERGCGIIGGRSDLIDKVKFVINYPVSSIPPEYLRYDVSTTVVKILLSKVPK